jgi:phosphatidylserine/phosphatidylglycerophosphate/cardiolipin synthase-like enzyme/uncharacterized membrane protein YdjX (TVP38/TMEM64 family)
LRQAETCWHITEADRAAFLIDGKAYFSALADCFQKARHCIYICGWDIDSRISLCRQNQSQKENSRLDHFLNQLCQKRPNLHIYILIWDFAMIYAFERQLMPVFHLSWRSHERIHFVMDDQHPAGGCHHQKIVVVDDKVAFSGGLDLTKWRWDTNEHSGRDLRRKDPAGQLYQPFHDVQMAVDANAAFRLGELFRSRWQKATGEILKPPEADEHDPWPTGLEPVAQHASLGIARTFPAFDGQGEVNEVLELYLEMIGSARSWIYIENQYFTSKAITAALAGALGKPNGPEVVLVLPQASVGWLEQSTMDARRKLMLNRLVQADKYGRLAIYHPMSQAPQKRPLNVHAKIMVVDDELARVGSANLSNRSMGLDSECDLVLEARGDAKVARAITLLTERLLGEHIGVEPEKIHHFIHEKKSLIQAVEALRVSSERLVPMEAPEPNGLEHALADSAELADPEKPLQSEHLLERFLPEEADTDERKGLKKFLALLFLLTCLAAAWRWGPLSEWLTPDYIANLAQSVKGSPMAVLVVVFSFVTAGILMVPLTFMIGMVAVVFPTIEAVFYSLAGAVVSGAIGYGLGRMLGRRTVGRIGGGRFNRISKKLLGKGLITVVALRMIPAAPYTIVNIVAGASQLDLRRFIFGTVLGLLPGIFAITVFADRLRAMFQNPHWGNILVLTLVSIAGIFGLWGMTRWVKRCHKKACASKK